MSARDFATWLAMTELDLEARDNPKAWDRDYTEEDDFQFLDSIE
jgi:hypothetical protein